MDVSDHTAEHFIFNSEHLEKKGAWGLFHEIGHNLQRDWWSMYPIVFASRAMNNELFFFFSIRWYN